LHSLRAPRLRAKALLAVAKARKSVEVLIFRSESCTWTNQDIIRPSRDKSLLISKY
jgi:hypothetical protein